MEYVNGTKELSFHMVSDIGLEDSKCRWLCFDIGSL